ncbi:tyrosine-type recombinase/integrase [Shinella sp.]|uniref:tyrosine-type recombinase/integrase n=1 Tax=Shinella sp. TaxID=1870904 RepID=UPI003F6E6D2B
MLTDAQIKKAKPAEKAYRLVDGNGLHLFVTPSGGKLWRYRYKVEGVEKLLSLGQYPLVSLLEARAARDDAKSNQRAGHDPSIVKKIKKLTGARSGKATFEELAREWHALQKPRWVERHADDVLYSLERDVFPHIGDLIPSDITPATVLGVLRMTENREAKETARRLRQRISAVFVYGIASGRADQDPAAVVTKAMAPLKKGKQPAVVDLEALHEMLRQTEAVPAYGVTKLAIRLLALTAVRPGTLATTPWSEFDELDRKKPVWRIPAERMKLKLEHKGDESRDHLVPLSHQAVEVIDAVRTITGKGPFVFPNARHAHKPMSENAMGYLLNRAGYHSKHVPHGFRSSFSTIMNERFPADRQVIDFMLAHVPKDKVESAYNRALYLPQRIKLAQEWAELLMQNAPPAMELLTGPVKILKR